MFQNGCEDIVAIGKNISFDRHFVACYSFSRKPATVNFWLYPVNNDSLIAKFFLVHMKIPESGTLLINSYIVYKGSP